MYVDDQTVSGLLEVPASISTEGARKRSGWSVCVCVGGLYMAAREERQLLKIS